jgi:hypothetical protein
MPDRVFEIPAVLQGVPHVLVVQALRVENLIECPYPSTGRVAGSSGRWPGGVQLLSVTELPKSLGPPTVVLVHWTSDNPVDAPDHLTSSVSEFFTLPRSVSPVT